MHSNKWEHDKKVGPGAPCPCGSTRLFGNCHGADAPPHIVEIAATVQGEQLIVVGAGKAFVMSDRATTPAEFLKLYLVLQLGGRWISEEMNRSFADQHEIAKWFSCLNEQLPGTHGLTSIVRTGASDSIFQLGFDFWLVRDQAKLPPRFVERLKSKTEFQGARYELAVLASLVVAGFPTTPLDGKRAGKPQPEWEAFDPVTGDRFAVEVKSRRRDGVMGFVATDPQPGNVYIDNLLTRAFAKQTDLPLIVYLDANLPPERDPYTDDESFKELDEAVTRREVEFGTSGIPANVVFCTNHFLHYILREPMQKYAGFTGSNIARITANPRRQLRYERLIFDRLKWAFERRQSIPMTFTRLTIIAPLRWPSGFPMY